MHNTVRTTLMVLCLIFISLSFVACDKANQMSNSGTYVSEKNQERYRELKSDGTFFAQEGRAASFSGNYKIEGNQITCTLPTGQAIRSKLEGKTMIDSDGERWTKK
ncbi:MAG: hypothetical protein FD159_2706 [Syntrophaceae bacterium]|nr:MAG: hypothetical protein FD159_2706 [Syntrophaceae bacterium]